MSQYMLGFCLNKTYISITVNCLISHEYKKDDCNYRKRRGFLFTVLRASRSVSVRARSKADREDEGFVGQKGRRCVEVHWGRA